MIPRKRSWETTHPIKNWKVVTTFISIFRRGNSFAIYPSSNIEIWTLARDQQLCNFKAGTRFPKRCCDLIPGGQIDLNSTAFTQSWLEMRKNWNLFPSILMITTMITGIWASHMEFRVAAIEQDMITSLETGSLTNLRFVSLLPLFSLTTESNSLSACLHLILFPLLPALDILLSVGTIPVERLLLRFLWCAHVPCIAIPIIQISALTFILIEFRV